MIVSLMADGSVYVTNNLTLVSLVPLIHKKESKSNQCMLYAHRYWLQRHKQIRVHQESATSFSSMKATVRPKQKVFELFVEDLVFPEM